MQTSVLALPNEPGSPAVARRAVAAQFSHHARCHDLLLCVSEVVSNAILHGEGPPRMRMLVDAASVRIEVEDQSPVMPMRKNYDQHSPTGRGLHILDQLTREWGAERRGVGKVVWFVFSLAEPAS